MAKTIVFPHVPARQRRTLLALTLGLPMFVVHTAKRWRAMSAWVHAGMAVVGSSLTPKEVGHVLTTVAVSTTEPGARAGVLEPVLRIASRIYGPAMFDQLVDGVREGAEQISRPDFSAPVWNEAIPMDVAIVIGD